MPFTELGYELTLDLLTDATNGINKVSIFTNVTETAKQTVNWAAASGGETSASVVMSDAELSFSISAGHIVQAVGLYHDTTYIAYFQFSTPFVFTNAGTFYLTDLTINLS